MICEARKKLTVWSLTGENKDVYWEKQASNAYHLLVPLFSSFTGSVVCHTLPLFGTFPLGIIWLSLRFLHSCSASAFFSGFVCLYADPLHSQPSWESAMPHTPVLTTIQCGTNFIAFLYKTWQKCTHINIYIYIYIYLRLVSSYTY